MKKAIVILMTMVLCAATSLTALAVTPITKVGDKDTKNVTGTYKAGSTASTVYSVDVSWNALLFDYTGESAGTWDPATHAYKDSKSASWSWVDESNKITVTNHSNAPINAGLSFSQSGTGTGVTGSFYSTSTTGGVAKTSIPLLTAVGTLRPSAPTGSAYLRITGGSLSTGQTSVTIGTVTVTLNAG